MRKLKRWAKRNPTRLAATLTVLVGWLALVVPDAATVGLTTLVGIWTGTAVWGAVEPVKP